ncbi:MAG: hypothetical protein QOG09_730 [Solirubrobacterales bacterium]|jgi:AbrB family looped-hinge helix DNA binding protein|nr:hypothetical protein [Solirubrobacterales bacterium]MDX6662628.1 hypothetical protein [Solirubrobacterales bacterium]
MTAGGERIAKVGLKGQVVVPKEIRDRLGIKPGDRVSISQGEGDVRVRRLLTLDELVGILEGAPGGGTQELEGLRREDRELEEAKWQRFEQWLNRS